MTSPAVASEKPAARKISPARMLTPYVLHADSLLAFERPPLYDTAAARIAEMKQLFLARQTGADPATANHLQTAVAACELLLAALAERDKAKAQPGGTAEQWKPRATELQKQIRELHRRLPAS